MARILFSLVSPEGIEPSRSHGAPAPQAGVYANFTTVTYRVLVLVARTILGRWCLRRDSNPHYTQFLRLRPLPVGLRGHER